VEELLARYVEEHVLHGVALDPQELCRGSRELLEPLREAIGEYELLGRALAPRSEEESSRLVGQLLGNRYRIRSLLGRGGMGEVWRAVDLKLRVEVALKALRAPRLSDERALESLRREVRAAREVISPNVCRVFDLIELDGQELVSMEYIDGVTLLDILKMRAPLDLTEAREIAVQFLAGLEAIHEAGLVHRDVKPENLMMTRSGRVVLMDLGVAKGLTEGKTGTVAGTPAYMAPEQARGEGPDARADVFSAGVVLAEMIAPSGLGSFQKRQAIWQGIHSEPPQVPDSSWAPVIRKAVARIPEQRYSGAAALARALEEVALRVDRAEDVKPYPGLASFGQEDAEYFFGRELEVEEMWKKLRRPQIYGLIGPSGAGKSSFLRAGLLPVIPTGWRAVVTVPGSQPFANLARALVPEVSGDTEALQALIHADDSEPLSKVVSGWRHQHDQVLLILDQFEELFTLNPPEVQERFAQLLAGLALEVDAHVLLSMRDDFLFSCSEQPALSPMISELTLLGAPSGAALRRALVQPALKCGYRFEDDSLVDEMIAEVEQERGALPLLAFAAARLWEHRDREQGLLTREAYEHIGGVAGALAQHAERTLERIGQDNIPTVRELFRNLVTAQGTRAARTRDELLSVFRREEAAGSGAGRFADRGIVRTADGETQSKRPAGAATENGDREAADRILNTLIDARLLTSYEVSGEGDESPRQRVEIIHESLLSNWPRLVRWQTQDQEGALLRDQLRQAAQMWSERGRPEDLLWTGTSYDEYQIWRERYRGGLSTAEESFTRAMKSHAERRKRRRMAAVAAAFAVLLVMLAVVFASREEARRQALRAEANQLLALGRLEIEDNPTGALAYALASLERADDPVARLFALEALARGPTARYLELPDVDVAYEGAASIDVSPDGNWLAAGYVDGSLKLWPSTGGAPKWLEKQSAGVGGRSRRGIASVSFGPESDRLVSRSWPSHEVKIWSIPDGRLVRTLPTVGPVDFRLAGDPARLFTFTRHGSRTRVEAWPLDEGGPELHGDLATELWEWSEGPDPWKLDIDPRGTRLVIGWRLGAAAERSQMPFVSGSEIRLGRLDGMASAPPESIGPHPEFVGGLWFHPDGEHLVSTHEGEARIWDLASGTEAPQRVLHPGPDLFVRLRFDPAGSRLVVASGDAAVWNLEGPPDADPLLVHDGLTVGGGFSDATFDPEGRWLATAGLSVILWPIERRYPLVLKGHETEVQGVAFLPDGKSIVSVSADGTLRLWPLSAAEAGGSRVLFDAGVSLEHLAVDPSGRHVLVGSLGQALWLVPLDGRPSRKLEDLALAGWEVALGEGTAAAHVRKSTQDQVIRVWDLATGEAQELELGESLDTTWGLELMPDDRLISSGPDGIRIWDLEDGSFETFSERIGLIDVTRDGRFLLVGLRGANQEAVLYDLEQGSSRQLDSHGYADYLALGPAGRFAVTVGEAGVQGRVGPVTGETPHLIVGPEAFRSPAVSPDGRWVTARPYRNDITLWPVPDLSKPPFHELPYEELLARLRALTNLRVVEDAESTTGWGWDLDPFPGWEEVPTW
jgi:WD40 repeat protein